MDMVVGKYLESKNGFNITLSGALLWVELQRRLSKSLYMSLESEAVCYDSGTNLVYFVWWGFHFSSQKFLDVILGLGLAYI